MLWEKIAINYVISKKHINPPCKENVEGFSDKTNGAYGNHRTFKGYSFEGEQIKIFLTLVVFGSL